MKCNSQRYRLGVCFEHLDDLSSERKNEDKARVDIPASLSQHRAMLGEPENQVFLTHAAMNTRGAQKQIPINIIVDRN
jgi:hypothetical protein